MEPDFPHHVGACVYCGAKDEPLSDEHVVPYGLEGQWRLLEASCSRHRDVTASFEREVLRGPLRVLRASMPMRTRRKAERPTHLPLKVRHGSELSTLTLPVERHPAFVAMPVFQAPGPISGSAEGGIAVQRFVLLSHRDRAKRFRETTDANAVAIPLPDLVAFARMLAKIGFCFAVACEGYESMAGAPVLNIILGQETSIGNWIGCRNQTQPPDSPNLHEVALWGAGLELWAHVRLFAQMGTPEYAVRLR